MNRIAENDIIKHFWDNILNVEFDFRHYLNEHVNRFIDFSFVLANITEPIKKSTLPGIGVVPANGKWLKGVYCEYNSMLREKEVKKEFKKYCTSIYLPENKEKLNEIVTYAGSFHDQLIWETSQCNNELYTEMKAFENFELPYQMSFETKKRIYGNEYTEADYLKDCIQFSNDIITDKILVSKQQGSRKWKEPYNDYLKNLHKARIRKFEKRLSKLSAIQSPKIKQKITPNKYSLRQVAIAYGIMNILITKENANEILKRHTTHKSVPKLLSKRINRTSDLCKISENKTTDTKTFKDLEAAKRLISGMKNKEAETNIERIITAFRTAYNSHYNN